MSSKNQKWKSTTQEKMTLQFHKIPLRIMLKTDQTKKTVMITWMKKSVMWIAKIRETLSNIFQLQKFCVAGELFNNAQNFGRNLKIKLFTAETGVPKWSEQLLRHRSRNVAGFP